MAILSNKPSSTLRSRKIEPGTSGWTVDELDAGGVSAGGPRFEIVHGVIALMAPARYYGNRALSRLVKLLQSTSEGAVGDFVFEPDLLISDETLYLPDVAWMKPEDDARQDVAASTEHREPGGRLLVPPTLIIESASAGHEGHDRNVKFRDYAEFGVPNYWILDELRKEIDCFRLDGHLYRLDCAGQQTEVIRPSLFRPNEIVLSKLW